MQLNISTSGLQESVAEELGAPVQQAATEAGDQAGANFGDSMAGQLAGIGSTVVVGMGLVEAWNDAVAGLDLQGSMRNQLGDGAYAAEAAETASALYRDGWGESLDEVGSAVASVGKELELLGDTGSLEDISNQAMVLASEFDQDVTGVMRAAGQMVKTGLADDVTEGMDLIAAGFQTGVNSSDDFLDTLNEYGGQFEKLGLDGQTAIGLLNQGLEGGARNADLVADAVKEFSIRSIDGSEATSDAFSAIGLDAAEMATAIAAGGDSASGAFQTTIDALSGIEDPVARNAAAVGLFGTQAEDLGSALFALDPSSAATGLGEVGGAADNAVANAVGATQAFDSLFRTITGTAGDIIAPALVWLTENEGAIAAIAIVVGVVLVGAMYAWAASLWAANAAMLANPITWIIVGIGALVAAIIWVATQTTFFQEAWANVTSAVATGWTWLWESVLSPVFTALGAIFTWIYESIILPVVTGIMIYIGLWAALVTWLYEVAIAPALALIGAIFTWIYESIIMPIVGYIVAYVQMWGAIFTWLWENAISPAFQFLAAGFAWIWASVISPVVGFIVGAITTVGDTVSSIFGGISEFIGNAFAAAADMARGPLNGLIGLVNGAIDGINSLSVTIPDWVPLVGGQTWSLDLPKIPELAAGATVLPKPGGTLALLAEAGRAEAVVDEGLLNRHLAETIRLAREAQGGSDGPPSVTNITVEKGDDETGEAVIRRYEQKKKLHEESVL
ncbi:hypothetical protein C5E10_18025 [Pseudoclavibacter sp. RFBG4]|nr:hypothetical protein C5E10_18025 [Pseudoclavibacter sp. RFBG4]